MPEAPLPLESLRGAVGLLAEGVATVAELGAAVIVGGAVLQALWLSLRAVTGRGGGTDNDKQTLRLRLGRWLAVSLEFLLAADILQTAIAPTWQDIGQLGAIALIRTALNYFLQREIEAHDRHTARTPEGGATPAPR